MGSTECPGTRRAASIASTDLGLRRIVTIAALIAGASLLASPPAHAATYCPKVQMFNAVGSGNRGEPDVTDAVRDEVLRPEREADTDPDLFFPWRVDYPAVSVKSLTGLRAATSASGPYHRSVVAGKDWLRKHLKSTVADCDGRTLIILSGYSQGAQVVGDVYQELERAGSADSIFAVVLFGDPYFNPSPDGMGSSQGKWRHSPRTSGALGRRPGYGRYRQRVVSYCHKRDPVCQNESSLTFSDHFNYAETGPGAPGEATDAGRWLSTRVRSAFAKQVHMVSSSCCTDSGWMLSGFNPPKKIGYEGSLTRVKKWSGWGSPVATANGSFLACSAPRWSSFCPGQKRRLPATMLVRLSDLGPCRVNNGHASGEDDWREGRAYRRTLRVVRVGGRVVDRRTFRHREVCGSPSASTERLLVGDYRFANTLATSAGAGAPLANLGPGDNVFATETVRGTEQNVLRFPPGNGVRFVASTPMNEYTVVVLMRLEELSSWRRILDFSDRTSDRGLYFLDGRLQFYPFQSGPTTVSPNEWVEVTLTRDAGGVVRSFVNGNLETTISDASPPHFATIADSLNFFLDDLEVANERSAGAVARIRVYNGLVTPGRNARLASSDPPTMPAP